MYVWSCSKSISKLTRLFYLRGEFWPSLGTFYSFSTTPYLPFSTQGRSDVPMSRHISWCSSKRPPLLAEIDSEAFQRCPTWPVFSFQSITFLKSSWLVIRFSRNLVCVTNFDAIFFLCMFGWLFISNWKLCKLFKSLAFAWGSIYREWWRKVVV